MRNRDTIEEMKSPHRESQKKIDIYMEKNQMEEKDTYYYAILTIKVAYQLPQT